MKRRSFFAALFACFLPKVKGQPVRACTRKQSDLSHDLARLRYSQDRDQNLSAALEDYKQRARESRERLKKFFENKTLPEIARISEHFANVLEAPIHRPWLR